MNVPFCYCTQLVPDLRNGNETNIDETHTNRPNISDQQNTFSSFKRQSLYESESLRDADDESDFRPSSQIKIDEKVDQFDENGNSPWAPKPSIRFDDYEDENEDDDDAYYVDDDEEVVGNEIVDGDLSQPREDDDESIRVAVWVDPSLKSGMGGLMTGINKFVRGSSRRTKKPKGGSRKPSSSYGAPNSNNNNKLKSFVTNLLPNNNQNGGGGKGFKLPNLSNLIPKGQNNQNQYGQAGTTRRPPKLPSLPKLPKLPNLPNLFKGSSTRQPSSEYGAPPTGTPNSGYGVPTRTPGSAKPNPKKKKKSRTTTRRPNVNTKLLPSTPPDFVFGPPIRFFHKKYKFN